MGGGREGREREREGWEGGGRGVRERDNFQRPTTYNIGLTRQQQSCGHERSSTYEEVGKWAALDSQPSRLEDH